MTKTNNVQGPNDDSNDVRPSSRRPATPASPCRSAPQEAVQPEVVSRALAREIITLAPIQMIESRISYWAMMLKKAMLNPERIVTTVKTNIRGPGDNRPLPRGIRPIPPPARARTRASTKSRRNVPQPRPPTIRPSPRPRPRQSAAARRARIAFVNARLADEDREVGLTLARIRDNMPAYEDRYELAVRVRDRLGVARWEQLEFERCRIAYFAYMLRKLDREDGSFSRADLDSQIPKMKDYVMRACGDHMACVFQYLHDNREAMLADEAAMEIPIQHGRVMSEIRELFHHQPFMWFIYNMYFPVRPGPLHVSSGRMDWKQLNDWAIWTFQHPTEQPSWYAWIRPDDLTVVQPTQVSVADSIWNAAMIEALEDADSRFYIGKF